MSPLSASELFAQSAAAIHTDHYFDVTLRGSGRAEIHAHHYDNPTAAGHLTILAVHGLAETGGTFEPLVSAIFADLRLATVVRRVVAIDLPGHGASSLPSLPAPLRFTDLMIEDNVAVVMQSLAQLRSEGVGAQVIVGHSMGGLAVQAAQEALLEAGSSLVDHGVTSAILLAPVPGRGAAWTLGASPDLSAFVIDDPQLGPYLDLAPDVFNAQSFSTLSGALVPNAPSAEAVRDNDWVGLEPITTLVELTGEHEPLWRPFVREHAFSLALGTQLAVVGFSQDILTPAVDQPELYRYLTGASEPHFFLVDAADAVHGMFISNPQALVPVLHNCLL